MDIEQFVTTSISQIAAAVHKLNEDFDTKYEHTKVNPIIGQLVVDHLHKIEFDIAITVEEKSGAASSTLKVTSFEQSVQSGQIAVSRIKFTIPTLLPQ